MHVGGLYIAGQAGQPRHACSAGQASPPSRLQPARPSRILTSRPRPGHQLAALTTNRSPTNQPRPSPNPYAANQLGHDHPTQPVRRPPDPVRRPLAHLAGQPQLGTSEADPPTEPDPAQARVATSARPPRLLGHQRKPATTRAGHEPEPGRQRKPVTTRAGSSTQAGHQPSWVANASRSPTKRANRAGRQPEPVTTQARGPVTNRAGHYPSPIARPGRPPLESGHPPHPGSSTQAGH